MNKNREGNGGINRATAFAIEIVRITAGIKGQRDAGRRRVEIPKYLRTSRWLIASYDRKNYFILPHIAIQCVCTKAVKPLCTAVLPYFAPNPPPSIPFPFSKTNKFPCYRAGLLHEGDLNSWKTILGNLLNILSQQTYRSGKWEIDAVPRSR